MKRRKSIQGNQTGVTKKTHRFSRIVFSPDGVLLKAHVRARGLTNNRSVRYVNVGAGSITEAVLIAEFRPAFLELIEQLPPVDMKPHTVDMPSLLAEVDAALAALETKRSRFQFAYGEGAMSLDDLRARKGELEAQEKELMEQRAEIEDAEEQIRLASERRGRARSLAERFDDVLVKPEAEANAILQDIIERIIVRDHHLAAIILR